MLVLSLARLIWKCPDISTESISVDNLLRKCGSRIAQQRIFDSLLLLGFVISVVGYYRILVMPTILTSLYLLVE